MDLYTYQISQWRRFKDRGIVLLDTTVKSGAYQLAPTWEMVLGIKAGSIDQDTYSQAYKNIIDYWYYNDPLFFESLITQSPVALGCYCPPNTFCHRHLLVKHLSTITDVNYLGELS